MATILNGDDGRLPAGSGHTFVIDEIHPSSTYAKGITASCPKVGDRLTMVEIDGTFQDPGDGSEWFMGRVASLEYGPITINGFRLTPRGQRGTPGASFPRPEKPEQEVHCLDGPSEVPAATQVAETSAPTPTVSAVPATDTEHPLESKNRVEEGPDLRLPEGSAERKQYPIITGVLDYFPDAIAEIARLSKYGNDKHNPGEALHWSRDKSDDHADCIGRHLVDRGTKDGDFYHDVMLAWRALANLQLLMEEEKGLGPSRGSV